MRQKTNNFYLRLSWNFNKSLLCLRILGFGEALASGAASAASFHDHQPKVGSLLALAAIGFCGATLWSCRALKRHAALPPPPSAPRYR